jgi:DnaK suppressor protein
MSKNGAVLKNEIDLEEGYRPSAEEPFMNLKQINYFRKKLIDWRDQLLSECNDTINQMQDHQYEADPLDAAASEFSKNIELRTRDRERKLINKIDDALKRIQDGNYGYCEETGEPIGLKRLEARPIATLSIEAQERHERQEKNHKD